MYIDTHAHIYSEEFASDRDEMLKHAFEAQVQRIVMPNVDHTSIEGMLDLELRYPDQCIATIGLHPCYVKDNFEAELRVVEDWLSRRRFAAIGEIGTDLYWDKTFWLQQQEAFSTQVNWAKQYKLPIIIHCRESIDETIALVEKLRDENLTGVFHCFSGNLDQARRVIAMNFKLGIGGVATFKKGGLDTVLPGIGMEHLVLETDSPYLAPVPYRGKRNQPAYIPIVASRVAEIKGITVEEVMSTTTKNASALFSLSF